MLRLIGVLLVLGVSVWAYMAVYEHEKNACEARGGSYVQTGTGVYVTRHSAGTYPVYGCVMPQRIEVQVGK